VKVRERRFWVRGLRRARVTTRIPHNAARGMPRDSMAPTCACATMVTSPVPQPMSSTTSPGTMPANAAVAARIARARPNVMIATTLS